MAEELAMLNDVEKCIACRGCSVACKQWKNLPAEQTPFDGEYQSRKDLTSNTLTIILMKEAMENGKVRWDFLKYQCMHCAEPQCMKLCPVGAIGKTQYGAVVVNESACIGCAACEKNCVFGVPHVSPTDNKSKKCNMCIDRIEKYVSSGYSRKYMPACAKTCPSGAISFGTKDEMIRLAKERLAVLKEKYPDACLYNIESSRGSGAMMYVLPYNPTVFGLPEEDLDGGSGATPSNAIYREYQNNFSK